MADILTMLPFLTVEDYLWGYSASFIRLMAYDKSRTRYLSKKEIEKRKRERERKRNSVDSADGLLRRLGMAGNPAAATKPVVGDWKQMVMAQQKKQQENQEPKQE